MGISIKNITQGSCVSTNANKSCVHCNRKGLAFLPVRYAVARHVQAEKFALPDHRIKSFTDIDLKKLVRTDGSWSSKTQTAWYVLRKLRDGYLYIYDEHPIHPHWLCYSIGYNGELTQFPANDPKTAQEVHCNIDINYTVSSLVALQDKNTDRIINMVFLDAPFSMERLNKIAKDAAWRNSHMQQLRLSQLASSPFCFSDTEIKKHVIEYGDDNPSIILKDDLDAGRFSNAEKYTNYKINNLDTFYSLLKAFSVVGGPSSPVYAIAIPDAVGIIKQLDMYRMSALNEFGDSLKKGDEGADKEHHYIDYTWKEYFLYSKIPNFDWMSRKRDCRYSFNERNYKWYLAVNKLKDLMEASLIVKEQDYGEMLRFGVPKYYLIDDDQDPRFDSWMLKRYKGLCYGAILDKYDNADTKASKNLFREMIGIYKESWERKKENALDRANKAKKEIIQDYVIFNDWDNIKNLFEDAYEKTKSVSIGFDSDYALWVKNSLSIDLDKYDKESPLHGACVTEIIADALKNGIISDSSKFLWNSMIDSEYSILDRGFSINGVWALDEIKKSISQYNKKNDKKSVITSSGNIDKELSGKIEKNAAKIRDFISKISNSEYKAAFEMKKSPILVTLKSLDTLHNTSVNSISSLLINDIEKEVNNGMGAGRGSIAIGLRFKNRLLEFHNFGNTINEAIYGKDSARFKIIEVKMTASQASQYVKSITKITGGMENNYSSGKVKTYNNGQLTGGNFQFENINSKEEVSVYALLEEGSADRIEKNMKLRGIDAMDSGIKELYEAQKKTLSKVKFGSASIIKLGCIYSLISAIHTYSDKKDFSSLWKLISSLLAVIQHVSESVSWSLTKVAESFLEKSTNATSKLLSEKLVKNAESATLTAEKSMIMSKSLGHAVSLMAVYDAVKGTIEAVDIYNSGGLSEDYTNKSISTGVSFISSVVVGLFISNIFIGAVVAVAAIAILFFFDVNRVVPSCIQNWLRRSKFGKEGETAPGRCFKSMQEEQDALSMLLKGLVLSIDIKSVREVRNKLQEEKNIIEILAESEVVLEGSGLVPGSEYKTKKIHHEKKNISAIVDFPSNFSGSFSLWLNNSKTIYMYFVDDNKKIARIVIGNFAYNESDYINKDVITDNDRIFNVTNDRVLEKGEFLTLKMGNGIEQSYNKSSIICVEDVSPKNMEFKIEEQFSIDLSENDNQKKLTMNFSSQSDGDILDESYDLVLTLGEDRKN